MRRERSGEKRNESVDVIMPVFNTPFAFLRSSIESVLNQTHRNVFLIIVDDGSNDALTLKVLNSFKNDKKVTVLHKKRQGVSSARNMGLDYSKSDYVMFLDGDDTIEYNYIEVMLASMRTQGADLVLSGKINSKTHLNDAPFKKHIIDLSKDAHVIAMKSPAFTSQGVLYLGEKARKCRFDEKISMGEDIIYLLNAINCGDKAFFDGCGGYNYIKHSGNCSISTNKNNIKKYLEDAEKIIECFSRFLKTDKDDNNKIRIMKIIQCLQRDKSESDVIIKSPLNKKREKVKKSRIILDKAISYRMKIMMLLINGNHFAVARKIMNLRDK